MVYYICSSIFHSTQKWPTGRLVNNAKVPNRLGHIHDESKRCHLHSIRCSRFERTKQASALSTFGRCRSRRSNWCTEVSGESCVCVYSFSCSTFNFWLYIFHLGSRKKRKSSFSPPTRSIRSLSPALSVKRFDSCRHFG